MSGSVDELRGNSSENAVRPCDLSSLSYSQQELSGRKKGTRLSRHEAISIENFNYAAREGIPEIEVPRVWLEFVDYWIGVPGSRGCKLDWDATWRNRVRALTPWKGKANGAKPNSLAAAGDKFIADAKEREEQERDGFLDLTAAGR